MATLDPRGLPLIEVPAQILVVRDAVLPRAGVGLGELAHLDRACRIGKKCRTSGSFMVILPWWGLLCLPTTAAFPMSVGRNLPSAASARIGRVADAGRGAGDHRVTALVPVGLMGFSY
jgi:hypothetical protein